MRPIICLAFAIAAGGAASGVGAQTAGMTGVVVDSVTGIALPDVLVSMTGVAGVTTTDTTGGFRLVSVPGGQATLFFRRPGYEPVAIRVQTTLGSARHDLSLGVVAMSPIAEQVVILPGLEVTARLPQSTIMPNLEELRRTQSGTFITAAEIAAIRPRNTSDVLRRLAGITSQGDFIEIGAGTLRGHRGSATMYGSSAGGNCTMRYYVDGVRMSTETIDVVQPETIAGIAVYRGSASIPITYRSPGRAPCGLIVLWTKDAANRVLR